MFQKEYDLFLAYHGTHENSDMLGICTRLCDFLTKNGIKVFFFPTEKSDNYKTNIAKVIQSKTFLLVCNNNINLLPDTGMLDIHKHYELATELDTFYALVGLKESVSAEDAKVFACGNPTDPQLYESRIHNLFVGRTYIYYDSTTRTEQDAFNDVLTWAKSRLDKWKPDQISSEVRLSFLKRPTMSSTINLPKRIANAKNIRIAGVSNIEITYYNRAALTEALKHGADVEVLFLNPNSPHTLSREREDYGNEKGILKGLTLFCIKDFEVFRQELDENERERCRALIYDKLPRFNIILLDDCAVIQYYVEGIPGSQCPCYYIERQDGVSPIYEFYEKMYESLKDCLCSIDVF